MANWVYKGANMGIIIVYARVWTISFFINFLKDYKIEFIKKTNKQSYRYVKSPPQIWAHLHLMTMKATQMASDSSWSVVTKSMGFSTTLQRNFDMRCTGKSEYTFSFLYAFSIEKDIHMGICTFVSTCTTNNTSDHTHLMFFTEFDLVKYNWQPNKACHLLKTL